MAGKYVEAMMKHFQKGSLLDKARTDPELREKIIRGVAATGEDTAALEKWFENGCVSKSEDDWEVERG